jgi:hypothetical protein
MPKGARNLTLQLKRHADFVFGTAYYPEKVAGEGLCSCHQKKCCVMGSESSALAIAAV